MECRARRWEDSVLFTNRTLDVWDEESGYRFVVASPSVEPELWDRFVSGALAAYRKYNVEAALEYDGIKDGGSTVLFFAALALDGSVVGGSRALGPYRSADESHVLSEWSEHEPRAAIRRILDGYLPDGVVEAKTGWVADGVLRRKELGAAVARMATYCMELLGSRFLVGTAADNALEMWKRCGGRVVDRVPPSPYPDARYRTRMLVWDLLRCRSEARSRQLEKLLASGDSPMIFGAPAIGVSGWSALYEEANGR